MPRNPGAPQEAHHWTIGIEDHHYLGLDGLPEEHRTVHQLQALEELSNFPYVFDTSSAAVEVISGGHAGELEAEPSLGPNVHKFDIHLDHTLQPGERTTVHYVTRFSYEEQPLPLYRRKIGKLTMERLHIAVNFHRQKLPAGIWWARWQGHHDTSPVVPGSMEAVELREQRHSSSPWIAHKTLENVPPETVLGFLWKW